LLRLPPCTRPYTRPRVTVSVAASRMRPRPTGLAHFLRFLRERSEVHDEPRSLSVRPKELGRIFVRCQCAPRARSCAVESCCFAGNTEHLGLRIGRYLLTRSVRTLPPTWKISPILGHPPCSRQVGLRASAEGPRLGFSTTRMSSLRGSCPAEARWVHRH
jgi:hypothetical protein